MPTDYRTRLTPSRFSLKALLAATAAIALLLGYSQWRRQTILRESDALKADGVQFVLRDAWVDRIWQRNPTNIVVTVKQNPDDADDAAQIRVREGLDRMGAKDVRYLAPTMEWPK